VAASNLCARTQVRNYQISFDGRNAFAESKFSIADLELDSEDVDRELIDEVEGKTHKENSTPTQQESSNGKQELTFSL